jgi:hypothetical protein
MVVMMASVKSTVISDVYPTDVRTVDDGDAEKPNWDDDINIDDIDPPTKTKSKAELKKQNKKERKKNKKAEDGVDVDEMDADLDAGADWDDWDDGGDEWKGTEEERKRKVDAYMDEVVNKLGFSGIVSLLSLQTRIVFTYKHCRRPTCLRVFTTLLWLLKITGLRPRKSCLRRTQS